MGLRDRYNGLMSQVDEAIILVLRNLQTRVAEAIDWLGLGICGID